jgi:hypothetical protein
MEITDDLRKISEWTAECGCTAAVMKSADIY